MIRLRTITQRLVQFVPPVLAVLGFSFALQRVLIARQEPPPKPPYNAPAETPYDRSVAGSGIVEPRTENIAIGTGVPGLVAEVRVQVGEAVKPGQLLFTIDSRALAADLRVRRASLDGMKAQLSKLENMPRMEEIQPSEYRVAEASARLVQAADRSRRAEKLLSQNAISDEEYVRVKQDFEMADKQMKQAESQHRLLMAGAWEADKAIARANILEAESQVAKIETELERLQIVAPKTVGVESYKVLQVNVRAGEFVAAPASQPLIVLGDIDHLHVRVDVDEYDITRYSSDAKAVAKLRGNPKIEFPLTFVRVDPYVIPKRSLTGDNSERVDTRVLQVIYALERQDAPVFVGQQMDVYIEAK